MPRKTSSNNARDERFVAEQRPDYRTPAQIDRDRILYSTSLARLAEVTQVVSADRGHVFHNRLTHSIKVGQLARRIAEKLLKDQPKEAEFLGGLDPDVAEAAGLAHDLGHPPFGHTAEKTLNQLLRKKGKLRDGFEGNAQSFRIVTRLAVSDALPKKTGQTIAGLNLTRATLNAVLKYPWVYGDNSKKQDKWGAYFSERELFEWTRSEQPFSGRVKSIEAELMDWADDITFAIHDLIDFFCAGQIPLERLADPEGKMERDAFFKEVFERCPDLGKRGSDFEDAFETIVDMFSIDRRYVGSSGQRRHLWRLSTVLISRFVEAILLKPNNQASPVTIEEYARDEIRVLKELTWHYVILRHELAADQRGQQHIIEGLFDILPSAARKEGDWKLFPFDVKERLEHASNAPSVIRVVADYIAAMTEKEAAKQFRSLNGAV